MVKPVIIGATAESAVTADEWLVQGTSSGVKPASGATASLGIAVTSESAGNKVGVLTQGLKKVTAAAATYKYGDALELDATGQVVTAVTTNPVVAKVAEDKTLASNGDLLVYVNL